MTAQGTRATMAGCAALLAVGCGAGSPRLSLAPSDTPPSHEDYDKIRKRWTRGARILKQLDTTLRVHATFLTPEFNAAYHARSVHMFGLSYHKREKLKRELSEQWSKAYAFIVASATLKHDWNDFDRKDSIWNITLANDRGEQVDATEIRRQPINATLKELFPYVGHFHQAYRLHFPKTLPSGRPLANRETRHLALRIAGPLGRSDLTWRLR